MLYGIAASQSSYANQSASYYEVVKDRLKEENNNQTIFVVSECKYARRNLDIENSSFNVKYPNGVFVICDAISDKKNTSLTVIRYLFNHSRAEVLVSSYISVKLIYLNNDWHIHSWNVTYRDYAP